MNFFKRLFNGAPETPEEEQKEQDARDFDVLKYDGVAALKQHVFDYAEKCFTHALDIHDDLETRDYLSQAYIQLGKLSEAIAQLRMLADAEPENLNIWLRIAGVAYMMEDYDTMVEACEKAKTIDDTDSRVNYDYARALIGKGDAPGAIEWLTKAVEKHGEEPSVRAEEGRKQLTKTVRGHEEEPCWDAYLLRGQTLLGIGKIEEAENDADVLLAHIPDMEDALLLKAQCQEKKGATEKAVDTLAKVIDANPFSMEAFRQRARLHRLLGNEKGALEDEQQVRELSPEKNVTPAPEAEDIARQTEEAYRKINPFT